MSRASECVFRVAAAPPFSFFQRRLEASCLLPYWHLVSDRTEPHVAPLYSYRSVAEFRSDVDALLRGRNPISLTDFLRSVEKDGQPPRRSVLFTFDDGFREMSDVVAPLLAAKGASAVFFLNSASLDNREMIFQQKIALVLTRCAEADFPLTAVGALLAEHGIQSPDLAAALRSIPWSQRALLDSVGQLCGCDFAEYLQRQQPYLTSQQAEGLLQRGFDIGAHSIDHPLYRNLTLDEQLGQTGESLDFLAARFPLRHRVFAFPHMDTGVSRQFFTTARERFGLEATFGTSAPSEDSAPRSYQRFSMEKTTLPADAILARQSLRRLKQQMTGRGVLQRN